MNSKSKILKQSSRTDDKHPQRKLKDDKTVTRKKAKENENETKTKQEDVQLKNKLQQGNVENKRTTDIKKKRQLLTKTNVSTVSKTVDKHDKTTHSTGTVPKSNTTPKSAITKSSLTRTASVRSVSRSNDRHPVTPPSNRVSKTQFFPSKSMYSSTIKLSSPKIHEENAKNLTPKSVTQVTTQSPKQVSPERPRTATLKHPTLLGKLLQKQQDSDNYEDDFDSYESDFEAYLSGDSNVSSSSSNFVQEITGTNSEMQEKINFDVEEDGKLDSGHFEVVESKHTPILDQIVETTELRKIEQSQSNLTSLSDEGYEEGKSLEKYTQFVNFVDAKKRYDELKNVNRRKKRGEEILGMIKLDFQTFTLYEAHSIPYDDFIRRHGSRNSVQVSVQTGDDDEDEEVQTEEIETMEKWTQNPVTFSKFDTNDKDYLWKYHMEYMGVGSNSIQKYNFNLQTNYDKLNKFLLNAWDSVKSLLHADEQSKEFEVNLTNIPFSDGCVQFNTNLSLLDNSEINYISFSIDGTTFLTTHTLRAYITNTIVCIWKVSYPNSPERILNMYSNITCARFGVSQLIFGGTDDGSIAVWDIGENNLKSQTNNELQVPSFVTGIDSGHSSKIVSIEVIAKVLNDTNIIGDNNKSFDAQIYTLDEEGTLFIWGLVILQQSIRRHITLVQNSRTSLKNFHPILKNMLCTDMIVHKVEPNHVFVSTNHGCILHHVVSGGKAKPNKFQPATGSSSAINCLASSSFSPCHFMVGSENGNVTLFYSKVEKPLMTMTLSNETLSPVQQIEWSGKKPCIFFTLHGDNNLHVWDLSFSDIFPKCSVPYEERIKYIALSPWEPNEDMKKKQFMVVITEENNIKMHLISKIFSQQSSNGYSADIQQFTNYVNRL